MIEIQTNFFARAKCFVKFSVNVSSARVDWKLTYPVSVFKSKNNSQHFAYKYDEFTATKPQPKQERKRRRRVVVGDVIAITNYDYDCARARRERDASGLGRVLIIHATGSVRRVFTILIRNTLLRVRPSRASFTTPRIYIPETMCLFSFFISFGSVLFVTASGQTFMYCTSQRTRSRNRFSRFVCFSFETGRVLLVAEHISTGSYWVGCH